MLRLEVGNKAAQIERGKLIERMKEKPKDAKEHRPPKEFEDKLRGALKKSDLETLKRDFNTMKEVTTKMKDAGEKLAKKEKKVKVVGTGSEKDLVQPIQKPIHLRSQKPMTRVSVDDVASVLEFDTLEKEPLGGKKKPFRMPVVDVDEPMDTSDTSKNVTGSLPEPKANSSEGTKAEAKAGSQSKGFCRKVEKEISLDMSRVDLGVTDTPCVPKSSSRFLQDWRQLRTIVNRYIMEVLSSQRLILYNMLRSKYLRQFKEEDYRVVFKSSLEGELKKVRQRFQFSNRCLVGGACGSVGAAGQQGGQP